MVAIAKWLTSMMCWIDRQLLLMLFLGWRLVVSADLLTLAASLRTHQIFSPVDIDAALAANAAHHAEIDIAPGVPINVLSRNSHIQALRKAMSDVSRGRPVDVASIVESASFSEIPWAQESAVSGS